MKSFLFLTMKLIKPIQTCFIFTLLFTLPSLVLGQTPIPPTPTPTSTPTPTPPPDIPTLSDSGYAIMYGLLALIAIWFILRRKKEA